MARDDIELVDSDYIRIPLVKPSRKIKFKSISFKNILSRWNKSRLERLKKKLETKKENLVGMEFPGDQLVPGAKRDRVEKRVLKKTQAIARLESKINFLENGNYYSEEFVDSRAIKLKTLMMQHLVYNRDSLYSVTKETAEEIMNSNGVDDIIDEETKKIGQRVREIMAEKEAAKQAQELESIPPIGPGLPGYKAPAAKVEPKLENIPAIGPGLPGYTAPAAEGTISQEETSAAIDENMDGINVTPVVSNDEVAAAIDSEMQKIKVSGNESSPAKVNKFINEDGTYRLRREDIDEDFRITRFDRSKLPMSEAAPVERNKEPEIPPFSTTAAKRKTPDVDAPRKAITAIVERKVYELPKISLPTINESFEDNTAKDEVAGREQPVVVPERKPVRVQVKKVETAAPVAEHPEEDFGDLSALIARVNLLKAEKQTIENMTEEARKKASSVDSAHREMMRRLSAYADSLEEDCSASYQSMNEVERNAATKEAQINAMIEIMASGEEPVQTATRRRGK